MNEELKRLSDTERQVMAVVWDRGPSRVREVLEVLNDRGRDWAYTTAKTVLDRLENKGYLTRDRSSRAHTYRPRISREELAQRRVRELRARFSPESTRPLIRALVEGGLDQDEIAELRAWLDDLEPADEGDAG